MGVDVQGAASVGLKPAAIRPFDIRGAYGRDLDEKDARVLGLAYATLAVAEGRQRIAVGRDGRLSSPAMEEALIRGLVEGGVAVTRIGLGPTPQVAFAVRHLHLDGGVMVTASHNPPGDTGFKLFLGERRIHGRALERLARGGGTEASGGSVRDVSVAEQYVDELARVGQGGRPLHVAWDCGSGATGEMLARLVKRLPGRHHVMNAEIDGRFPAHHPDPAVAANMRDLQAAVVENQCDLGVAFDGDGDRIGVVDSSGAIIFSDHLLLLLATDILAHNPGATVVGDVKCSRALFDGVRGLGGRAVLAPSGYVPVREMMRDEGALLGGELSGHIFYADDWDGTDDALYVAMRLLKVLSGRETTLLDFRASLPAFVATPEYRISCSDSRKDEIVREVSERLERSGAKVDKSDGLRVETMDGWWLLRASNTEARITCRSEAFTEEGLARLMDALRHQLRASGVHDL